MRPHQSYAVVPQLPKALEHLRELAWNLRFSWDPATRDLFRMIPRAYLREVEEKVGPGDPALRLAAGRLQGLWQERC